MTETQTVSGAKHSQARQAPRGELRLVCPGEASDHPDVHVVLVDKDPFKNVVAFVNGVTTLSNADSPNPCLVCFLSRGMTRFSIDRRGSPCLVGAIAEVRDDREMQLSIFLRVRVTEEDDVVEMGAFEGDRVF